MSLAVGLMTCYTNASRVELRARPGAASHVISHNRTTKPLAFFSMYQVVRGTVGSTSHDHVLFANIVVDV